MPFHPKLLVSVRDSQEAAAARAGGADIIDLKEPAAGSLGMASVQTITDVLKWKATNHIATPISAALGELAEWDTRGCTIPGGLSFVKVGLAGESSDGFQERLDAFKARIVFNPDNEFSNARNQQTAEPKWVTVAYADVENANSPSVEQIARCAMKSQSAGLLIDTFSKTGVPLTEYISVEYLTELRAMLNENGKFFALAGQIRPDQFDALSAIHPDIVAVRSAVCADGNRQLQVEQSAVARLKQLLTTNLASPQVARNQ